MKDTTYSRPRYFVGLVTVRVPGLGGSRELFRSATVPTFDTHGARYGATIGPFRTKRGAIFMRDHGRANPHCQCVNDAERIAAGYSYDIAIRKWVRTRAALAFVSQS